jgi:hypothetical protein
MSDDTMPDERDDERDELSAAARTLHREWDSPALWPSIAAAVGREASSTRRPRGWRLAAAAVLLIAAAGSLTWVGERLLIRSTTDAPRTLLSEESLENVERAEERYSSAIEGLARAAAPAMARADSPLLVNLRERLTVIDAAIAECRAEIDRNRFNAHLRRHLLSIYQEKRRTLEQILELEQHAS